MRNPMHTPARPPLTGFVWDVSYKVVNGRVWPKLTMTRGAGETVIVGLTDDTARPIRGSKITLQPADYREWPQEAPARA